MEDTVIDVINPVRITDPVVRETAQRVRAHLLAQGQQASSLQGSCRYRLVMPDETVLKCAIGCLIVDEAYDPLMEGAGVELLSVALDGSWDGDGREGVLARALNMSGIPASIEMRDALTRLQIIHDGRPVERWDAEITRAVPL